MTYKPIITASSVSRDYGYRIGGYANGFSSATEKYDDVANTWAFKASMNIQRYLGSGFSLNGYGYAAGAAYPALASTERYDNVINTWTMTANLNVANGAMSGFSLNGYGYVAGGWTSTNTTERYNDMANLWTTRSNLTNGRGALSAFSLSGYGYTAGGEPSSPITEKYDDLANTWTVKASMNTGRRALVGFSLNSYGYTMGGLTIPGDSGSATAISEKYNDIANIWTTIANISTATSYLAGFSINGYGYIFGARTERYDDIANSWTLKAPTNEANSSNFGIGLGALQTGVQNPEIIPIYKTLGNRLGRMRAVKTPVNGGTPTQGEPGEICWDTSYTYICIATNTWRRFAHASW